MSVRSIRQNALFWAALLVAVAMLILVLIPSEVWHHPINDAVYRGFDRELIVTSETSFPARGQGVVDVSPSSLKLTALADSRPAVTLLTTPLRSFRAAMDLRVLQSPETGEPLRIGIWSARTKAGQFLVFGPGNVVTTETIQQGGAAQTLVGGIITKSEVLGTYAPGLAYHLEIVLDKNSGRIRTHLTRADALPAGGAVLRLVGGPNDPRYSDVVSEPVPVDAGKTYSFGGLVELASGSDAYKITVQWLDQDLNVLSVDNDWHSVRELLGSTEREFTAPAPAGATLARLALGSGNGTQLLFGNLFLREADGSGNLLGNGDLQSGAQGWALKNRPSAAPNIVLVGPVSFDTTAKATDAPELFGSLRLSLTASASSTTGSSVSELQNYSLILPHERWQVDKVADSRSIFAVIVLVVAGALLLTVASFLWLWRVQRQWRVHSDTFVFLSKPTLLPRPRLLIIGGTVVVIFLALNGLLFKLGSLPFDMLAEKIWSYVSVASNPTALYLRPDTVSLAKVWGGAPYHEAVFPYQFPFAYLAAFIGWMYKIFLNGPGVLKMDTYELEFLIKSINVLFNLADSILIYLILQQLRAGRFWSLLGGVLLLFNPAILFSTSVWGQNHVVSIFFLLLAIWLAERKQPLLAWLSLFATALNRPQMLIPAFLLGLVFLRSFSFRQSLHAAAWGVVVMFLLMAPFAVRYGPSMPVDLMRNDLQVQEAGGNESELTTVSLYAYSVWPLADRFASSDFGLDRFSQPAASRFVGPLSYLRAGELLSGAVVFIAGAVLVLLRRSAGTPGDYLPLVALGTMGFLMFKTVVAPTHFILALPLLILCRRALGNSVYFWCIGVLTVTTLVAMYGDFGSGITPELVPALAGTNNIVTRFVMDLSSADWFISIAVFQNLVVLICLAVIALQGIPGIWQRRIGFQRDGGPA